MLTLGVVVVVMPVVLVVLVVLLVVQGGGMGDDLFAFVRPLTPRLSPPQVRRALRPRGRFLSLTFAQPHFRKPLYARREYRWSVAQHTYGDGFHYFLYAMTAGEELSPEDAAMETRRLEEAEAPPPQVTFMQESDTEDFLGNIAL